MIRLGEEERVQFVSDDPLHMWEWEMGNARVTDVSGGKEE